MIEEKVVRERPKKRSILSMRKQKAREMCFSSTNSLMNFQPISQEMQRLELKKRNDQLKERELKKREQVNQFLAA